MSWIKKYICTVLILAGFGSSIIWMNKKFNEIEKTLVIIKAVFVLRDLMRVEIDSKTDELDPSYKSEQEVMNNTLCIPKLNKE